MQWCQSFNLSIGLLPAKYLGIPFFNKRFSKALFQPLMDSDQKMINSWPSRFLAFVYHLRVDYNLSSPLFNLSPYIGFHLYQFLFHLLLILTRYSGISFGPKATSPKHFVQLIGLKFVFLRLKKVYVLNWQLISQGFSFEVDMGSNQQKGFTLDSIGYCQYLMGVKQKNYESSFWKSLLNMRTYDAELFTYKIRNGLNTNLWYAPWLSSGPISQRRDFNEYNMDYQRNLTVSSIIQNKCWQLPPPANSFINSVWKISTLYLLMISILLFGNQTSMILQ